MKSSRPLYYGGSGAAAGGGSGGRGPAYYGGTTYGGSAYYYGGAYGSSSGGGGEDSMLGTLSAGRILRVVAQRWILVLVALLIGLVVAFAVYRISPTIYEATSEFTMDMKSRSGMNGSVLTAGMETPDLGNTFEEVLNTRMADWRSNKIIGQIINQYHATYPSSTVSDEELTSTLTDSKIDLVRHSRLITISVRSKNPQLAAALANAYMKAIESFTEDDAKERIERAVARLASNTEKKGREVDTTEKKLLDYRMANKLDVLLAKRDMLKQGITKTTADILNLETQETAASEWEKVLAKVQKDPDSFGSLPDSVPRSAEMSQSFNAYQKTLIEKNALLARFTAAHPEVKAKERETEIYKQQFCDVISRAYATAQGNLKALRNQLAEFRDKRAELDGDLVANEQKIVSVESGLEQLERQKTVDTQLYQEMLSKLNEARILAEQQTETVRPGRPATEPKKPVLPQPMIIFPVGAFVGFAFGILFVLALDHLEDTVIGIADIEGRLSLKVLAVLPHVRRKKREQVARFVAEDKYSQFAEAVAGLRNLLDSPRYQMLSQVVLNISTQPGEGKTITSCSIAISNAQAGKKTLLVDFDMRRPRLARVWNLKLDASTSFSHSLQKNDASVFPSLVQKSGVENLDIIASLPPDGVNPASIMGSQIVPEFFNWAREHYERVVIDSPPYGLVGDVTTLATLADSVMILCCPDRTRSKPIRHATRHLTEAGATILGVIVNDVDMSSGSAFLPTSRSYGYGYGGYGGYGGYRGYGAYRPRGGAAKQIDGKAAGGAAAGKPGDPAAAGAAGAAKPDGQGQAQGSGQERRQRPSDGMDIADDD